MGLSPTQLLTLKTDIQANTNTVQIADTPTQIKDVPAGADNAFAIAAWYVGFPADFWVWRSIVTKSDLVNSVGPESTTFNWTGNGFITRSVGEQTAWRELFNGTNSVNPSLANVRQAFADIFSGTGNAAANRTHLLAVARRKANRIEKLLAAGTGSTSVPATMGYEGGVSGSNVEQAMGW